MTKRNTTEERLEEMRTAIALSESARIRMREELSAFADFHPSNGDRPQEAGRRNGFILSQRVMRLSLTLAIVLAFGSSTSFAAESSLPGDLLYPIKKVNENVRGSLAFSDASKARLETNLLERRFIEAELLGAENRLDEETRHSLSAQINTHIDRTHAFAESLNTSGDSSLAADIRSDVEGAVAAHTGILAAISAGTRGTELALLATDIRQNTESPLASEISLSLRAEVNDTEDDEPARAALRRAREAVEGAEKLRSSIRSTNATIHERADQRIDDAARSLAEAEALLEAEEYEAARASADAAVRVAREIKFFLRGTSRINLDLNFSDAEQTDRQNSDLRSERIMERDAERAGLREEENAEQSDGPRDTEGGRTLELEI